jgi:hypothetical protein
MADQPLQTFLTGRKKCAEEKEQHKTVDHN